MSRRPVAGGNAGLKLVLLAGFLAWIALGAPPAPAGATAPRAHEAAALKAPRQLSPADGADTEGVPSFAWAPARGAAKYEFQLSADPAFKSIVLGQGRGSYQTANRFATVDRTLAD